MIKKCIITICFLGIMGLVAVDSYGKSESGCQKSAVASDANSAKASPIKALMKKCGLEKKSCAAKNEKTCCCKGCPAGCKCVCCDKAVDVNSTGVVKSTMKKCGKAIGCGQKCSDVCKCKCCTKVCKCANCPADCKCKSCCAKTAAACKAGDPNDTGMTKKLMKKCGLNKQCGDVCQCACCKKKCAADPNSKDTGLISSLKEKCNLKKLCCKKAADANCPSTPPAKK